VQAGDEDDYFRSILFALARRRVVWLLVVLAAFIPLLIGTGGNVGAQSSTVVIRGLSTQRLQSLGPWRAIGRELVAGARLGGLLAFAVVPWAWTMGGSALVATSAGISLVAITTLAATAGAGLPLLFERLGFDPAGDFIGLKIAQLLLPRLGTG
jgi:magnesium transporter